MFEGYLPFVLKGAVLTIQVALLSLLIALLIGVVTALVKLYAKRPFRAIATLYTTVIRGIPDIVLMMLIFFGGQIALNKIGAYFGWGYIDINPFIAGTLTIGFIFGAYMAETFRGALQAIPKGQVEAAQACGMNAAQIFFNITLPIMLRHALPGIMNNWLVLVKTTALVSLIGLHDMVYKAGVAANSLGKPFTFYLLVGLIFLLITFVSEQMVAWLKRRYIKGGL